MNEEKGEQIRNHEPLIRNDLRNKKKRTLSHGSAGLSDDFKSFNYFDEEQKKEEEEITEHLDFSGNNNSSQQLLNQQ